ncbi:hypothetical protein KBT16_16605 [Nostoc sp. CCCryo 231-06]|nr:hypothetical protein [Nostoc sp. CCCryo 231-06]
MTVQELIDKLSSFNNSSGVCVEDTFVWINTRFEIKELFQADDGAIIIQTQTVYYDEDMSPYILDSEGKCHRA